MLESFQPFQKFRNSFLFKFTVHFLSFALLFVSCTTETLTNYPVNADFNTKDYSTNYRSKDSPESIGLYNALEIVRTVGYQNEFTTADEYFNYFFSDIEALNEQRMVIENELNTYHQMGFESYFNLKENDGQISSNIKNWSIEFKNKLNDYLLIQNPSQAEFEKYFSDVNRFLYIDNYSENEIDFITDVIAKTKDAGKYFYIHYYETSNGLRDSDCSFIESIYCFILLIPVYSTVYFLSIGVAGYIYATRDKDKEFFGVKMENPWKGESYWEIYVSITKLVMEQYWEWCCGRKKDEACGPPEGAFYKVNGCNSYDYVVYGPGTYSTTVWDIENPNSLSVVTPTSKIHVSIPIPGDPSVMNANILCFGDIDDVVPIVNFSWEESLTFESEDPYIYLSWGQYVPPSDVDILNEYDLEVNCNVFGNNHYTFTWSESDDYFIHGSSGDYIIEFEPSEEIPVLVTVDFTVENVCTGDVKTISKTFNVDNI